MPGAKKCTAKDFKAGRWLDINGFCPVKKNCASQTLSALARFTTIGSVAGLRDHLEERFARAVPPLHRMDRIRIAGEIRRHDRAYYVEGRQIITDREYDLLFKELQELEKNPAP